MAHIALGCAVGAGKKVLFVSPSRDLLEHRQLRLAPRSTCFFISEAMKRTPGVSGFTVWASPDTLDPARLARVFGAEGPDFIFVEEVASASSQSGTYRPSWSRLNELLKRWKDVPLICAAQGATPSLRKSVGAALGTKSFDRSKLPQRAKKGLRTVLLSESFTKTAPEGADALGTRLLVKQDENLNAAEIIAPLPRPALVLCSTPAQADQVFAELEEKQVPVHRFHSALSASERARELVHFALPGRRAVMVAVSGFGPNCGFAGTKSNELPDAFGRGYAREDLRSVIHLCAPCSLAQYAQELTLLSPVTALGDGGRSPRQNVAVMLFSAQHLMLNLALLERLRPAPETLGMLVNQFMGQSSDSWLEEIRLADSIGGSVRDTNNALLFLEDAGAIERSAGRARVLMAGAELKALTESLGQALLELSAGDERRLQEVEDYAVSTECRTATLTKLLGRQTDETNCGACDVCLPNAEADSTEGDDECLPGAEADPSELGAWDESTATGIDLKASTKSIAAQASPSVEEPIAELFAISEPEARSQREGAKPALRSRRSPARRGTPQRDSKRTKATQSEAKRARDAG